MKPKLLFLFAALALGSLAKAQTAYQPSEDGALFAAKEARMNNVKLYARKDKSVITITSHRSFDVQIYIFSLDGEIQYQGTLKKKEKKRVENLEKGTYTYSIFFNDESIEEGKLTIK